MTGPIPSGKGARRAWGLPPITREARVYVLGDGTTLIAQADGTMQPWPPFGFRSIASDPDATRTRG